MGVDHRGQSVGASIEQIGVLGQRMHYGKAFPLALRWRGERGLDGPLGWLVRNREELLRRVGEQGAILFRGFGPVNAEDFDRFVAAFGLANFPYEQSLSNAVRVNKTPRVFTANEAPASATIYLHHEMAQTPVYPSRLFFFCEQAAATGGATPLCRSDVLLEELERQCPRFVRDCREKGLKYTNVMPAANDASSGMGRSWQSTLGATTREEVESRLGQLQYTWEWLTDGSLRATTPVLPSVKKLASGRESFFNQLIAAAQGWKDTRNDPSKAITFGDGSLLDREAVGILTQIAEQLSFDIPWENGDVALVDNYLTMHGRRTFTGTRKVLASLIAAEV
jgi:hypothetical protein